MGTLAAFLNSRKNYQKHFRIFALMHLHFLMLCTSLLCTVVKISVLQGQVCVDLMDAWFALH